MSLHEMHLGLCQRFVLLYYFHCVDYCWLGCRADVQPVNNDTVNILNFGLTWRY